MFQKILIALLLLPCIASYYSISNLHTQSPVKHTTKIAQGLDKFKLKQTESPVVLTAAEANSIRRKVDKDFIHVSVPAFLSLAAEPMVTLVDASYVGKLATVQQAGAGIATSSQYSISKLYNDPLMKTSTSLVAGKTGDELQAAVATAISSAVVIGVIQGLAFVLFASQILRFMGVSAQSPMKDPAINFLKWLALGVPASTVLLVTNGIFRGRGDTKTPLFCTLTGNLVNILLDPVLIFGCNMGCGGAAAALSISQWVAATPMLYLLHRSVPFNIFRQDKKRLAAAIKSYTKAGGLILIRTIAKTAGLTATASAAARLGPIPMAAYSLTFKLGMSAAKLGDSVAIAAQAFLARDMPFETQEKQIAARHVINRSLQFGLLISLGLVSTTAWNLDKLLKGMTSSAEVRAAALQVMPIVMFSQIFKGVSISTGAILLGGCDWIWSTMIMNIATAVCLILLMVLPPTLQNIWSAFSAFMVIQVVVALFRVGSGTGPWKNLYKWKLPWSEDSKK